MDVHGIGADTNHAFSNLRDIRRRRHGHLAFLMVKHQHHDTSNGSRPNKASTDTSK